MFSAHRPPRRHDDGAFAFRFLEGWGRYLSTDNSSAELLGRRSF